MAEKDDSKADILSTLTDIENSGFDVLLQQLFAQLKVPYLWPTPSCPMAQLIPGQCMFSCCAQISDSNQPSSEGTGWVLTHSAAGPQPLLELVLKPAGKRGAVTYA